MIEKAWWVYTDRSGSPARFFISHFDQCLTGHTLLFMSVGAVLEQNNIRVIARAFLQEQSAGAYLAMAVLLLLGARRHLEGLLRRAFLVPWRKAPPEERAARALTATKRLLNAFGAQKTK